jgi:hypothetical protein
MWVFRGAAHIRGTTAASMRLEKDKCSCFPGEESAIALALLTADRVALYLGELAISRESGRLRKPYSTSRRARMTNVARSVLCNARAASFMPSG